jgi:hypothetical protein
LKGVILISPFLSVDELIREILGNFMFKTVGKKFFKGSFGNDENIVQIKSQVSIYQGK